MANITSIMNKIARDAMVLGLNVVSQQYDGFGNASVTLTSDVGTLTVSYLLAEIQVPMGGVNPMVSPYLGIGVANPGQLLIQSSSSTNGNVSDIITGPISCQILALVSGFDNDMYLANSATVVGAADNASALSGGYFFRVRGDNDLLGMGN
jgi:hypothetical protein